MHLNLSNTLMSLLLLAVCLLALALPTTATPPAPTGVFVGDSLEVSR